MDIEAGATSSFYGPVAIGSDTTIAAGGATFTNAGSTMFAGGENHGVVVASGSTFTTKVNT